MEKAILPTDISKVLNRAAALLCDHNIIIDRYARLIRILAQ